MLQRNPELPDIDSQTFSKNTPLEADALAATEERFQKYLNRRSFWMSIGKVAIAGGLFVNAHTSLYLADARANMLAINDAQPTVSVELPAPESSDGADATIHFQGFNAYDADYFVKKIGPGYQESFGGEALSVQYNNVPLDSSKLSQVVQEKIKTEGIDSINFTSYSMGDAPMVDVMLDTIASSWVNVENINILSGLADFDSLTPAAKKELEFAKTIEDIPFIEYSTLFRYWLEVYFYRKDISHNASNAIGGINTRFINGNVTTNSFLASQINSVTESNIPQKIEQIGTYADTKHMPNINVIVIKDGMDHVVDNSVSAEKICAAAIKAKLHCTVVEVTSRHGAYFTPNSIQEYTQAFATLDQIVQPYTARETARHALDIYSYYQDDAILGQ